MNQIFTSKRLVKKTSILNWLFGVLEVHKHKVTSAKLEGSAELGSRAGPGIYTGRIGSSALVVEWVSWVPTKKKKMLVSDVKNLNAASCFPEYSSRCVVWVIFSFCLMQAETFGRFCLGGSSFITSSL